MSSGIQNENDPVVLPAPRHGTEIVLPDPEVARRWGELVPGAPQDLWNTFKEASQSRMKDEALLREMARSKSTRETIGQITSFIILLVGLVGACYLIHDGKSVEGLALVLSPLGVAAGVLLYYRHTSQKR